MALFDLPSRTDALTADRVVVPARVQAAAASAGGAEVGPGTLGRATPRPFPWALGLALSIGLGGLGCDGTSRSLDAAATPVARMSSLSVRFDVTAGKQPTLTALAFRAAFSGVASPEVLGRVDPLAAAGPARDCQLRDLDSGAAALAARGDGIELEELSGVGIQLAEIASAVHPSPRLYPDVAPAIGGVVSEAGPVLLPAWPAEVRVTTLATTEVAPFDGTVDVPAPAQITAVNGVVPSGAAAVAMASADDLKLDLGPGAADTAIELRPFGATVALVCTVPSDTSVTGPGSFTVPRQLLTALVAATGAAPGGAVAASLDLVRRQSVAAPLGADARTPIAIAVEVRSSSLVELRP